MRSRKPAQISYVQNCITNNRLFKRKKDRTFLKYIICMYMNNPILENNPCLSVNDNISYRTSFLMSLSYVYSNIQLYIQRYTSTHSYIKARHEIPPNAFH